MPERLPSDHESRRAIEQATGETLFVEAGAGTGKTSGLVGRILALVREGVPIDAIAAITFTEKAASELSERVRKRLEEEAPKSAGETQQRYQQAIKDLDQAAIQTLHSFAMRILSLYPLEAGLPPRIKLRDDVEATLAFDERWQRFQDTLLDDPEVEAPLLRGLTIGLRLRDLREVAERFNESWERLQGLEFPGVEPPALDAGRVMEPIAAVAAQRRPSADDTLTEKLDSLAGFLEFLGGARAALAAATTAEARLNAEAHILRLLSRVDRLTKPRFPARVLGNKQNWDVEAARALMTEAETARREMLDGTRSACICALLPHIAEFVLEGAAERRRLGELEFHDLLVLARNLLRDNAEARRALHTRFRRVLIDEFQDTDPIQVELAALLADPMAAAGWQQTQVEPGRLFFVGDPKQSIYRFRRADIDLFKRARSAFRSRHVPLTQNFRCRPGIIDWVNEVCGAAFDGYGDGADARQADWIALEAFREPVRRPTVHHIGGSREGLMPQIRGEEADAIVAAILQARRDNWLKQNDPKAKDTRFADIAILLPTRTNSPVIERKLADAGIPVRVESRSLLFAAQEIRDLTNILAAIDDPTDDVAVVAALRSPAFAVPDTDLLVHANASGRWDYTADAPEDSPDTIKEAWESLRGFHARRWHASIGALVEGVIAERKMLELAVATRRPREAWRRLRFVAEQSRALGDSGTVSSLRQFVHWLRTQASEAARIAEAVATEPDDDAVRLLTIHAAKGLEFPIVILAGLGIPPRPFMPRVLWSEGAGTDGAAVRIGRSENYFDTPEYAHSLELEREQSFLERDRLFYVAATRAKERLVVSLFHKRPPAKDTHSQRHRERKCSIAECVATVVAQHSEWDVLQHGMAMGNGDIATGTSEDTPEEREAWRAQRQERLERLAKARVSAATALAHARDGDDDETERDDVPEAEPWKKGRAGTSVGRAVHAVLQTIDLATGQGLESTADAQAVAEGIADEGRHIVRLVESARNSNVVRAAVASGKLWREVYVGASLEGTLVEGFIDLLYEAPEGLVVVDYKTDSARDLAAIERAMEKYRLQGAAYALVLEAALQRPVARVVFVFAEPRHEQVLDDLDAAKAEVLSRLRALTPAGR